MNTILSETLEVLPVLSKGTNRFIFKAETIATQLPAGSKSLVFISSTKNLFFVF